MARKQQHIAIFTTASLPWLTGTAVNPLFRAAYLGKDGQRAVTLVIPWLTVKHQKLVYPSNITFNSPSEHEAYVRSWLEERVSFRLNLNICFYPGKFATDKRSILPVGDISDSISDEEADIAVLEEPEHLTWFHHGKRWKAKFRYVVGIVHTNYLEYVKREKGLLRAFLLEYMNGWVVGIYSHKVIRLSAATQEYPRSIVCNVHGVNPKFLEIGEQKLDQQKLGNQPFTKGAYYIGKMVWSKGYKELLELLHDYQNELAGIEVDLYGHGEDSEQIKEAAENLKSLTVRVHPGRDHADPIFHDYKVFLNPSTTDVVCTTTAEALAMGKTVVCANHSSNEFFKQFPNCLTYDDGEGFVHSTLKALNEQPSQLTDLHRHQLSWESATERFIDAAELGGSVESKLQKTSSISSAFGSATLSLGRNLEDASAYLHFLASGNEASRKAFGAIPGSLEPDEELCKELGLTPKSPTIEESRKDRWF